MEIRHYRQIDESAVVDLWNRTCTFDALSVTKFRRQAILDENFDAALSWYAVPSTVGFTLLHQILNKILAVLSGNILILVLYWYL